MSVLGTYPFAYRKQFAEPKKRFPDLASGVGFQISLQTSDGYYLGLVTCDCAYINCCIEFYDAQSNLFQTRLAVVENINLFYKEGYSLTYSMKDQAFIFQGGGQRNNL